jgi:hypothetical protein
MPALTRTRILLDVQINALRCPQIPVEKRKETSLLCLKKLERHRDHIHTPKLLKLETARAHEQINH